MSSISSSYNYPENYVPTLKESVLPRKILACMPILGHIICLKSLWNLETQFDKKNNSNERKIEILNTANYYHKCDIAHRVLGIAILTALVAYGIFTGGIGFLGIALAVGIGYYLTHVITNDAYEISENNRKIAAFTQASEIKKESEVVAPAVVSAPVVDGPLYPSLEEQAH